MNEWNTKVHCSPRLQTTMQKQIWVMTQLLSSFRGTGSHTDPNKWVQIIEITFNEGLLFHHEGQYKGQYNSFPLICLPWRWRLKNLLEILVWRTVCFLVSQRQIYTVSIVSGVMERRYNQWARAWDNCMVLICAGLWKAQKYLSIGLFPDYLQEHFLVCARQYGYTQVRLFKNMVIWSGNQKTPYCTFKRWRRDVRLCVWEGGWLASWVMGEVEKLRDARQAVNVLKRG